MTQNEATRKQSESLREESHEAFLEQESDMESAIDGFKEAIDVLAAIGGDGFLQEPEPTKFMAGHKEALVARKTLSQANLWMRTV
jgi:diacylglycerol kinase family enzyme